MSPAAASPDAKVFASASLWIVDLDGVVWLGGEPIGPVGGAVAALRGRGIHVVFATNNSAPTTGELLGRLRRIGIESTPDELATSAAAVASLLEAGQRVTVLAEAGVHESLAARGVEVVEPGSADDAGDAGRSEAAVVGWSRSFDFGSLAATATAARRSGRLIGTNEDPTHPTPDGLMPGSGALLAAVATASGVTPEIAGKPHAAMASLMQSRFGFAAGDASVVMIGDQPGTDGRLAQRLGIPFGLVDSGVTAAGSDRFDVPVGIRATDFASLVDTCLGHRV
jgi:HAD superfamily hydrolase (TIGR01450 family)